MGEIKTLGKMPAPIKKITVNDATFRNVVIEPTYINFFYGRNGAGKSTIALAMDQKAVKKSSIEWQNGKSASDYDVLVYNQDFIKRNFEKYDNVGGVFTVCEENIETTKKVKVKTEQRDKLDEDAAGQQAEIDRKTEARDGLLGILQDACWDKTKELRETLKQACSGMGRKKALLDILKGVKTPQAHNLDDVQQLYDVAFDKGARSYRFFSRAGSTATYGSLPGKDLLDKAVVSSSDTPFAKFMTALGNTDWVRNGHTHYTARAKGKCPFCQSDLPEDFEKNIAASFDDQYQQDIDEIRKFQMAYSSETAAIIRTLQNNLTDTLPGLDLTEYQDKLALLESNIAINVQHIADKMKEPMLRVELEDTDSLLLEIGNLIDGINKKIKANNDIASDQRNKKKDCEDAVKEHLASLIADDIQNYNDNYAKLSKEIKALEATLKKTKGDSEALTVEIDELNRQVVNTEATINSMNDLLRDSGFQGFSLRVRKDKENMYEVVRKENDGVVRVVENLSEGERNFIAFLYFFHLVKGSPNSKAPKDKIVVIDDPVSSMDSGALCIVGSLVREMIDVCYNNTDYKGDLELGNYIKQIFILTHNVYFHSEVTYKQEKNFRSTSFYKVLKANNDSTVEICVRTNPAKPSENENYNPVQNSYKAMWTELKEAKTAIPALSVIRQILEYYFMQMCGYDRKLLRKQVLEGKHKNLFIIDAVPGGKPDYRKYHKADTLLAYISSPSGIGSEVHLVEDSESAEPYKEAFKLIFEAMEQGQHYKMMMELD